MRFRTRLWQAAAVAGLVVLNGVPLPGQGSEPSFIPIGLQPKRAYFAQLPFESVDMVNGNLILTFTDLTLPGDGGMDLVVQRSYNKQGVGWRFGLRGVPMEVSNPEAPYPVGGEDGEKDGQSRIRPTLRMADGSEQPMVPYSGLEAIDVWVTEHFSRYTLATRRVELPNGWVAQYTHDPGRALLQEVADPYGNRITVDWQPYNPSDFTTRRPSKFTQHLQYDTREVLLSYDSGILTPSSMTFAGRTWTYGYAPNTPNLTSVAPPAGGSWQFDYSNGLRVTTPYGGTVHYAFDSQAFPDDGGSSRQVVRSRSTGGHAVAPGTWQFEYDPQSPAHLGSFGTASGPHGLSIHFSHEWGYLAGRWVLTRKAQRDNGQDISVLSRSYEFLSITPYQSGGSAPVPSVDVITQDGATYQTTYGYRANNESEHFGDYHRPWRITESGTQQHPRQTDLTYDYNLSPYMIGPVSTETVTINGGSSTRSFEYEDATGFMISETRSGVTTTFGRDSGGNRTSVTDANNHTTSSTFHWGVPKDTTTPEYGIARTINSDGTVASETRGDITRTFVYDGLGRPERVSESGADDTVTTYGAHNVTVSRGPSFSTTDLDGFGRPVGTSNSAGVLTETHYDALGNTIFQSYPRAGGSPSGDSFEYDLLGRVEVVRHSDNSQMSYTYSGGDTVITDEKGRTTRQRWRAFGAPEDARLMSVVDARDKEWGYGYDVVGNLRSVTGPDGSVRSWQYNARNFLEYETHPENGTTRFEHDNVGNVKYKREPEREVFYEYDGNNRLTKIDVGSADTVTFTYDALDNRRSITNGTVASTLHYVHGHLMWREDTMGGRTHKTFYEYDGRGNLTKVTYPSERYVRFIIDNADRITEVRGSGPSGEQVFAGDVQYHASGAISSFTYGNGQQESLTLDNRQRPDLLGSGPLSLNYDHDEVGNVTSITDPRPSRSSTFGYDPLDRLETVSGFGARTFTYDDVGNRTTQTIGTTTWTYNYDRNRLMSINAPVEFGGGHFDYDAAGNMKLDPSGRTYDYNAMNMMTVARGATGASSYGYEGDNLRKFRSTDEGVFYYVHGPGGQLLAEYDATGGQPELLREYVYLGTRLLASIGRGAVPEPPLSVRLSEPAAGDEFPNDEPFTIGAIPKVTIPGDTVARVEFYRDGILIGSDSSPP